MYYSGEVAIDVTPSVDEIGRINFDVPVTLTPKNWFKAIQTEAGKPDVIAITLLADIIYWYRPSYTYNEPGSKLIKIKKKFKEDKLQRSTKQLAETFGFSISQIQRALKRLDDMGIITREFRNVPMGDMGMMANIMYIEPNSEAIDNITNPKLENQISSDVTTNLSIPPCKFATHTKSTSKITKEFFTKISVSDETHQCGEENIYSRSTPDEIIPARKKSNKSPDTKSPAEKLRRQAKIDTKKEKKAFPAINPAEDVQRLFDNYYKNRHSKWFEKFKPATAYANRAIEYINLALKGDLFNDDPELQKYHNYRFTIDQIDRAMENMEMAMSPEYDEKYRAQAMYDMHIDKFMYNNFKGANTKSYLIYWHERDPVRKVKFEEETYSTMMEIFKGKFFTGTAPAHNRLIKTCETVMQANISKGWDLCEKDLATWLIEALEETYKDYPTHIGFLASDKTLNYVLPQYLKRKGYIK